MSNSGRVVYHGAGIGTCIAVFLSMTMHNSILWALIHGFCGWFYVLYCVVKY